MNQISMRLLGIENIPRTLVKINKSNKLNYFHQHFFAMSSCLSKSEFWFSN